MAPKKRTLWSGVSGDPSNQNSSFPTPPNLRPPRLKRFPDPHTHTTSSANGNGTKRPVGRPPRYDPQWHPRVAYDFCSHSGFSNEQLADLFGFGVHVISYWLREHTEFHNAVKNGRWDFDSGKVQKSLAARACGYDITERTYEYRMNEETGIREKVLTREVTKHVPPDPTSIIFWLCNRQKDHWRREVKHEHSGRIETRDGALAVMLRELLKKSQPQVINSLKESLETIACANSDPL